MFAYRPITTSLLMLLAVTSIPKPAQAVTYPRVTIAQAVQLPDDSPVAIAGRFVESVPGEEDEFIFQDSEGSRILIYAENRSRVGLVLNRRVVIFGLVDRGEAIPEINLVRINADGGSSNAAPRLEITSPGTRQVTTSRGRLVIRGKSTDANSVRFKVGTQRTRPTLGNPERWRAVVRLTPGLPTPVRIIARGPGGAARTTLVLQWNG